MKELLSKRMKAFGESIFSELSQIKKSKLSEGLEMIDLSIGSPDLPTPSFVTKVLSDESANPNSYGYTLTGADYFKQAVTTFYKRQYGVQLEADQEVLLLMGSQEGLVHFPMVYCDPGDIVLAPDPGYPAYEAGIALAGATVYPMSLKKENNFLPDLKSIPEEVAQKAKILILNYPGNPVPALATYEFYEEVVFFARKYNIIVLSDFAYSELYFDEEKPISFLSVPGAKEVGIEMNSMSKTFNMAGSRIAYAVGNKHIIKAFLNLKSNLDYGVFQPIQKAAAEALLNESDFLENNRMIYKERRDLLINGFRKLGWKVDSPKASMFIWAKIPDGYQSKSFALELIEKANVVVTPGNAFGPSGEGYVRIAIVQPIEKLQIALVNMENSGMFQKESILISNKHES